MTGPIEKKDDKTDESRDLSLEKAKVNNQIDSPRNRLPTNIT